jgi:hypothetical protein
VTITITRSQLQLATRQNQHLSREVTRTTAVLREV